MYSYTSTSTFRYCLDGPVIFTDEVIWFCEDCEEKIDIDYYLELIVRIQMKVEKI